MGIVKLIIFIVANLPSLISAIKQMIDYFDGDKKAAKASLGQFPAALKLAKSKDITGVKKALGLS